MFFDQVNEMLVETGHMPQAPLPERPIRKGTTYKEAIERTLKAITTIALLDPSPMVVKTVVMMARAHDEMVQSLSENKSPAGYRVIGTQIACTVPDDLSDPDLSRKLAVVLQQLLNSGGLILAVDRWHQALLRYSKHTSAVSGLPSTLTSGANCYGLDLYVEGVRPVHDFQSHFYANMPAFSEDDLQAIASAVPMIEFRGTTMSFSPIIMSQRVAFLR